MKSLTIISASICLTAFFTTTSQARIGESLEQCDARYGKVTFKNAERDFEYRSYLVSGKTVRVVFFRGESLMELIESGPYTKFAIKDHAQESIQFFMGLLSSAYEFTDEQIQTLGNIKQTTRTEATSVATKGDLRATYSITEETKDEVTIKNAIIKMNVDTGGQDLAVFFGNSFALHMKSLLKARANGF